MRIILVLIILVVSFVNSAARNFLVTKIGDTLYFERSVDWNHKDHTRSRKVNAGGSSYKIRDIRCIQSEDDFYFNFKDHQFLKRVIKGSINIYAAKERDTICGKNRILSKKVFIQKENSLIVEEYNNKTLGRIIEHDSLNKVVQHKLNMRPVVTTCFTAGCSTIGITAIVSGASLLDKSFTPASAVRAIMFLAVGLGNVIFGAKVRERHVEMRLDPVYFYNSL